MTHQKYISLVPGDTIRWHDGELWMVISHCRDQDNEYVLSTITWLSFGSMGWQLWAASYLPFDVLDKSGERCVLFKTR